MDVHFDSLLGDAHQRRLLEDAMATLESADDVSNHAETDDYEPITQEEVEEELAQLRQVIEE